MQDTIQTEAYGTEYEVEYDANWVNGYDGQHYDIDLLSVKEITESGLSDEILSTIATKVYGELTSKVLEVLP